MEDRYSFFRAVAADTLPARYETQIDLEPGEYDLRVVLSDGSKFGRAKAHLLIEPYDREHLSMSSVVLCRRFRIASVATQEAAAANLAPQYVPLVSKGLQFTPSAETQFRKGKPLIAYFEVYEPLLATQPKAKVQAHMRIVSTKTGRIAEDFAPFDVSSYERPGSTMIPVSQEIKVPKGEYRLEVQATDSAGRSTSWRTAGFSVVE